MKKFGQVLTCVFVVVALIALVGCGISKEDHEKVDSELSKTKADLDKSTAELNKAKADLAQANSKAAALEKSLNEAKGQTEEKVAAAQKQAGDLQAKVDSLSKENAELEGMLDKLKAQIAELQKKVGGARCRPRIRLPSQQSNRRGMPPWHANPQYGKFFNEARLTDDETQLLRTWVANGCPQGDSADLPMLKPFTDGWQIKQPDLVYKMSEPYQVPATGIVEYQFFTLEENLKEEKWIKMAEARPGNRAVTHHLILFYQEPGKPFEPIDALFNSIVGFAPGLPPAIYPTGVYPRIPKGSKLILQAHYTPNGSPQTDQSEVDIV